MWGHFYQQTHFRLITNIADINSYITPYHSGGMQIQWVFYSFGHCQTARIIERLVPASPPPQFPYTFLLSAVLQTCQNWCERRHSISEQSVHDKATSPEPFISSSNPHAQPSPLRLPSQTWARLQGPSLTLGPWRTVSNKHDLFDFTLYCAMLVIMLLCIVFLNISKV